MISLMRRDFNTIPLFVYILFFLGLLLGYSLFFLPVTLLAVVLFATFCFTPYLVEGQRAVSKYFASLPISRKTLVRSRYLYAAIWIVGISAGVWAIMVLASLFREDVYVMSWQAWLCYASLLFIFIALSLPHFFLYRFQVASFVVLLQMILLFNVFFSAVIVGLFDDAMVETADGFFVEMTSQSLDRGFEVIAGNWSTATNLLFFSGAMTLFFLSYAIVVKFYKHKNLA